ncbi:MULTISPECIES: cytochrome P450 family protein [Streptomyces]|uniref:Cytochrome n=2 Tax=Streptomyces TaxID=1883 RepID=A0A0W7X8T7_9ACTN|nr:MULTISPECIES: cytochrome P450 [Streptomyces]KUF19127.1 cytochrome [Streptomyces silvensis]MVO88448.1 cytochrome P450 [Streptomyces typhae]
MCAGGTTIDLLELSPDFVRDPHPVYAALRAKGPVHRVRTPDGPEVYLVLGLQACRAAYTDARLSRDWRGQGRLGQIINAAPDDPSLAHMSMADPPDHTRLRRLVSREFTPRRIQALAPRVQQIADTLLDEMTANGARSAEFLSAFAFPLAITVICELLGVPELDRAAFRRWSNEILAPAGPAAQSAAYAEQAAYLPRLVGDKRAAPGQDLLSALIHAVDEDGDRLAPDELIGMCSLLLIAGHETVVNQIGNGLRALFAHPGQLDLLRADLSLAEGAVEEMLRYEGPVESTLERLALTDIEMGGVLIPAGATVRIVVSDAGRDGAHFAFPDRFDIRRDTRGHIAFGHGLHYCLGAPLARLEGRIALRSLLTRCPGITADADLADLEWLPGMLIRGVRSLPVRW